VMLFGWWCITLTSNDDHIVFQRHKFRAIEGDFCHFCWSSVVADPLCMFKRWVYPSDLEDIDRPSPLDIQAEEA
jgi:hypothetical protein